MDDTTDAAGAASGRAGAPQVARRAVTMGDVATRAGVSRTAVSFVLNDRPDASLAPATRRRILDAAAALSYRPNAWARALASQASGLYGLVTEIVTAPFAVDIVKGAQDASHERGKLLLIAADDDATRDSGSIERILERLLEQRVEGLAFATTVHREVRVPEALREVPTVLINCVDPEFEFPSIVPDEVGGGLRATRRLLEAGHTRIGLITLDPRLPATSGRREGYERALREAGLEVPLRYVAVGGATAAAGYEAAARLLDCAPAPRPTALFCMNDRLAMGAYDAVKERGLRIPDDIALIGFDNQEVISAYLRPGLTTVALPFQTMGRLGIETLAALTAGQPVVPRQVTVDCPLLERSSV